MVSEQLLNVLKLCLLALMYLFFLRVLRAVWVEVKGPALTASATPAAPAHPGKATRSGKSKGKDRHGRKHLPSTLRVIAPPEAIGATFPLSEEVTIGRAAGCQITLDDTYASQMHAKVYVRDGQMYLDDLGSTNGTWLNREKVTGPLVARIGDHVQVGNTVMELV